MDYDFSRLSTRAFEQLIQALAAVVVGPGIVVFGDGPDGGREATFDGRISFPDPSANWHGYGVVQAKFRQRMGDTGKDGNWALRELEKELKKFAHSARALRKPEYYLFATNVVLSPVADEGAKDKAAKLIETYREALGLKDYRIWDHDQLCTLLDAHPEVRTAYTAWITPGDVLAAVLERMKPQEKNFREVMVNYVQKELLTEQHANLGQAGKCTRDHVPLAKVFVDLPVGESDGASGTVLLDDNSFKQAKKETSGAIKELLVLSGQRLDPLSYPRPSGINLAKGVGSAAQVPGRVVFVGGPGQGKSTLSQFVCQLHRVALFDQYSSGTLPPEVVDTCALIREQCSQESVSLPAMPRFPVRVELNRFAAALAGNQVSSLFDYLLQRIRKRTERSLCADDLRSWLRTYPWLIVLDGLDEVPASSNRSEVLVAVQDFLMDAGGCNADLLLIATTRPQGYNDDFSPKYYQHRHLLPLTVPQALHYAKRLVGHRWGSDPEKIQQLMERIERAGKEEATARLMRSPLQVTIMTLLVENIGQPPRERWRLFNDYYHVIFRREKERDIPAAELLNTYQADIDAIHQQVGLRLQVDSERSGGTEALLSEDDFCEVVKGRLEKEGHSGCDLIALQSQMVNATLDRLVFLVPPQEGKIGFEIRSLQEFMAAQSIMSGSDEEIRTKLRAIANASHWRNVFLFAAGRCFNDKQHLRDSLHTLCCELNEDDDQSHEKKIEKAILSGSRLALDILEDGAVANQPGQLRLYARLAMRLIELPPCSEQVRLARQYRPEFQELFQTEIQRFLADALVEHRLGAWRVALYLSNQGIIWATALTEKLWPSDAETAIKIIKSAEGSDFSDLLVSRIWESILSLPPSKFPSQLIKKWDDNQDIRLLSKAPSWWAQIWRMRQENSLIEIKVEGVNEVFEFTLTGVAMSQEEDDASPAPFVHPAWVWLYKATKLAKMPLDSFIAKMVSEYHDLVKEDVFLFSGGWDACVPWPISSCIRHSLQEKSLDGCISSILKGELGTIDEWVGAEKRWAENGVSVEDIQYTPDGYIPFDRSIANIGFPFIVAGSRITIDKKQLLGALEDVYYYWKANSNLAVRRCLAGDLIFLLGVVGERGLLISNDIACDLKNIIVDCELRFIRLDLLNSLPSDYWVTEDAVDFLSALGKYDANFWVRNHIGDSAKWIEGMLIDRPQNKDVRFLFSRVCVCGYRPLRLNIEMTDNKKEAPRYQLATLLLKLALDFCADEDLVMIAATLIELHREIEGAVDDAICIVKLQSPGARVERFLVSLFEGLPQYSWEARRNTLLAMEEQQRHRLSNTDLLI